MPKTRAERLREYLESSNNWEERLERISRIKLNEDVLKGNEASIVNGYVQEFFVPTKMVDDREVLDTEKLKENVAIAHKFVTKLNIERGKETLKWLAYFDKKGIKRDRFGRNTNIEKAAVMAQNSKVSMLFNGFSKLENMIDGVLKLPEALPGEPSTLEQIMAYVNHNPSLEGFTDEEKALFAISLQGGSGKLIKDDVNTYAMFCEEMVSVDQPWMTKEDIDEYRERRALYKGTYDKDKGQELFEEMDKQEINGNPVEIRNNNPETFMEKSEYRDVYSVYVCRQLGNGKKLGEVLSKSPTYDELEDARKFFLNCMELDDEAQEEQLRTMLVKAQKSIKEGNEALCQEILDKTDDPRLDKYVTVQSEIMEFGERMQVEVGTLNELRRIVVMNKNDFANGYGKRLANDRNWENAYGSYMKDNNITEEKLPKEFLEGGFSSSTSYRKYSMLGNAYFYKILKNPPYDISKGIDADYAKDCGNEYMKFLKENPVFKNGGGELIDDKEQLKKSIDNHAKFYRDWGEYIATSFTFGDYTKTENIEKDAAKLNLLAGMIMEFGQNSDSMRRVQGEEFYEAFGGKKYYQALSDSLGCVQVVSDLTTTIMDKTASPKNRALCKCFLVKAEEDGATLKGKTPFSLDARVFGRERTELFRGLILGEFGKYKPSELDRIAETGIVPKRLEEKINEAWEKSKAAINEDVAKHQKLVADRLGIAYQKKASDDLSTGFENTSQVMFSKRLKEALLKEGRDIVPIYEDAFISYMREHPERAIEGFDERSVREFLRLTDNPNWTREERMAYAQRFCEDFTESAEKRNALLDKVYDKLDSFSYKNYDLSCLHPGKDKGEPGPDGLTPSERDFISFARLAKAEQALRTTRYCLPEYYSKRYSTLEDNVKLNTQLNNLMSYGTPIGAMFEGNGVSYTEWSPKMIIKREGDALVAENVPIISNRLTDAKNKLIEGANPEELDGYIYLNIPEAKGADAIELRNISLVTQVETCTGNTDISATVKLKMDWSDYDSIYIDGKRARDFVEPFMKERDGEGKKIDEMISNGEHTIDVVCLGLNKDGDVVPFINTVRFKESDKPNPEPVDKDRAERLSKIRIDVNRRLGPNKNFTNFMTAKDMDITPELYEKLGKEYPAKIEPSESLSDMGKRLGTELKNIDHWYHINSAEFNNVIKALNTPENAQNVVNACNAYLKRYVDERGDYKRSTELGNDRMEKINEIKGLYKDAIAKQKREENLKSGLLKEKDVKKLKPKELTNEEEIKKESGIVERKIGTVPKKENSLKAPSLDGPGINV